MMTEEAGWPGKFSARLPPPELCLACTISRAFQLGSGVLDLSLVIRVLKRRQRPKLAEIQIPSLQTQAHCSICGLSPQLIKISISLIRAQMMFVTKWDGLMVLVTLPGPFCGAV